MFIQPYFGIIFPECHISLLLFTTKQVRSCLHFLLLLPHGHHAVTGRPTRHCSCSVHSRPSCGWIRQPRSTCVLPDTVAAWGVATALMKTSSLRSWDCALLVFSVPFWLFLFSNVPLLQPTSSESVSSSQGHVLGLLFSPHTSCASAIMCWLLHRFYWKTFLLNPRHVNPAASWTAPPNHPQEPRLNSFTPVPVLFCHLYYF